MSQNKLNDLIQSASEASDIYGDDELERFAEEQRKKDLESPWGTIQTQKSIVKGLLDVVTAGHSGLKVRPSLQKKLSDFTKNHGIKFGENLFYSGHDASALVLLDLGLFEGGVLAGVSNINLPPKKTRLLSTICSWYPGYLEVNPEIKKELTLDHCDRLKESSDRLKKEYDIKKSPEKCVLAAMSLTSFSDFVRIFSIKKVEDGKSLLIQMQKVFENNSFSGSVFDEKFKEFLKDFPEKQKKNLTAVWSADKKIYVVDGYKSLKEGSYLLENCGKIYFSCKE